MIYSKLCYLERYLKYVIFFGKSGNSPFYKEEQKNKETKDTKKYQWTKDEIIRTTHQLSLSRLPLDANLTSTHDLTVDILLPRYE